MEALFTLFLVVIFIASAVYKFKALKEVSLKWFLPLFAGFPAEIIGWIALSVAVADLFK